MPGKSIKITSRAGGAFDCYLSLPAGGGQVPAVVLAAAVELRKLAEFGERVGKIGLAGLDLLEPRLRAFA